MGVILRKKLDPKDKSMLFTRPTPKSQFSGTAPNLLIGAYGYPHVTVGALVDEDKKTQLDNPKILAKTNNDINNILSQRQSLINSQAKINVKAVRQSKFSIQTQDIAMSLRPVDSEVELTKPLTASMKFYEQAMPHGPSAELKKLDITSNPLIPKKVENLTGDTDVLATTAMNELQNKGYDEYYLTRLLSAGTLGKQRKIVPTKWAITAVDDTYGNKLREEILDNKESDLKLYKGDYLGNYYIIVVQPGEWSFELLEIALPDSEYNDLNVPTIGIDYEFSPGRKKYAENTTGGYYAARLPILEFFKKNKLQGRVSVFRFITKEYTVPLGVWVVREGVRNSLSNPLQNEDFSSKDLKNILSREFKQHNLSNVSEILGASVLLKMRQTSLNSFFG